MMSFGMKAKVELRSEPHCVGIGYCLSNKKNTDTVWFESRAAMARFATELLKLLVDEKAERRNADGK